MENQEFNQQDQVQETPSFEFMSDEEVNQINEQADSYIQSEQPDILDLSGEEPYSEPEPNQQTYSDESYEEETYSDQQIEEAVFSYLSERLGQNISSIDDLYYEQSEPVTLDERISVIADFVEKTGRSPQDWFMYQSLDPSEMDDMTAIRFQMANDYPNLSQEEISTLVAGKYKTNPEMYSEDEIKLSALQLKIDAQEARNSIEDLRGSYQAPAERDVEEDSLINDEWIGNMTSELDSLEGVEFDLGDGKTFTFGLENDYKSHLAEKNARLDEYFDPYVREDGSWDFDKLNVHRAVVDNMESIVKSIYRQGLSDGQRGIVERAANVTPQSPQVTNNQTQIDSVAQQLREAMGSSKLTFNI